MNSSLVGSRFAVASMFVLTLSALPRPATATPYTFTKINVPLANETDVQGINNAGQIVGSYNDATGRRVVFWQHQRRCQSLRRCSAWVRASWQCSGLVAVAHRARRSERRQASPDGRRPRHGYQPKDSQRTAPHETIRTDAAAAENTNETGLDRPRQNPPELRAYNGWLVL
jgi:hypothetical protein